MPIAATLPVAVQQSPRPITTIPAAPSTALAPTVAGYARCSQLETGEDSLQNQIIHLDEVIHSTPGYRPGVVYHDDGISGTQAFNRPGLQQMLTDCRAGRIQLIIVKSISRLSRNVEDLVSIVRELSSLGVTCVFEKESLRTDNIASSFLIQTMATVAEYESTSIGSNVRIGHRARFKLGTHKVFHAPYGFDAVDGHLVINPAEAAIVREIYSRFLAGEGGVRIAKDLQARGIPTKKGGRWYAGTVLAIIKNPASYGTIVNQKYYREDHKVRINRGELEMFVQDGRYPGIVGEGVFNRAQELMAGRRAHYNTFRIEEDEESAWFRLQRSCFSSHLFCNQCSSTLHRANQYKNGPDVDPQMGKGWTWKCSEHAKDGKLCSMTPVKEVDITRAFLNVVNKLIYSMSTDLPLLDLFIEALLGDEEDRNAEVLERLNDELQKIEYERQTATDLASRSAIAPAAFREKMISLDRREGEIKIAKTKLEWSHAVQETEKVKTLLSSPSAVDHNASDEHRRGQVVITTFDEVLFAGIVERVVVQSRQFITFELKCGLKFTEYFAELAPGCCADGPTLSNAAGASADTAHSKQEQKNSGGDETAPFRPPYGYKRVDGKIEVEPEEAEKLRVFFQLLAGGSSIDAAGLAAGIPRKGSGLYKIAHRKAYAGTALYPSIIDASLIRIKNSDNRRVPFVPLYSDFEYGMIPEIDQNLSPAECISVLFREIRPVAAFQPGVADYPRKATTQPVVNELSSVPISAIKPISTTTDVHTAATAPAAAASAAAPTADHKGDPVQTDTVEETQPVAHDILLPVNKISRKRRVVDLAIEMHNRRLSASPAASSATIASSVAPLEEEAKKSVAPGPVPVKDIIEVTIRGRTGTKKSDMPAPTPPSPRRAITVSVSAR